MRVLALDAALARCSAALVVRGAVVAELHADGVRGHAAALPPLADTVLQQGGLAASALDLIAVTVGPGGFTGLRAALALAHGLSLAAAVPLVGVTVGEAIAERLPALGRRTLWVAIDSRRGQVFLECQGRVTAEALDALPAPETPVALAGDAAVAVAARLAARGHDVMLTNARLPMARHVASVGAIRHAGALPPLAAQPLYVDPPAVRLPAAPPRPPPA
jgi:tRNA threonylcarbamoyladenosine biosynthesis protein TsaB